MKSTLKSGTHCAEGRMSYSPDRDTKEQERERERDMGEFRFDEHIFCNQKI